MKSKLMSRGWECPKCGAVMSPYKDVCVNCIGEILNIFSGPITSPSEMKLDINNADLFIPIENGGVDGKPKQSK